MTYLRLKQALNTIEIATALIAEQLEPFVKNKTTPLNLRWELFAQSSAGSYESVSQDFVALEEMFGGEILWYEDFNIGEGAIVDMVDIVTRLERDVDADYKMYDRATITAESLAEFKEEILQRFVRTFRYSF